RGEGPVEPVGDGLALEEVAVFAREHAVHPDSREFPVELVPVPIRIDRSAGDLDVLLESEETAFEPVTHPIRSPLPDAEAPEPAPMDHAHVVEIHDVLEDVAARRLHAAFKGL